MTGRPAAARPEHATPPFAASSGVTPGQRRHPRPVAVPDPVAGCGPVVGSACTGYGGLDLGVLAALGGGRLAWVADPDPHVAQVLAARMAGTPNLGDLRVIDWTRVEPVDVLVAGFPCQDISGAGKRAGIEKGARSGLWTDIVAGVRALSPALVVVENVAALRWRGGGLHRVLGDLADAGYDALWRSVRAADIGAAHRRERVFLLGWARPAQPSREPGSQHGRAGSRGGRDVADTDRARRLLERHLRRQPTGWAIVAGPAAAAADPSRVPCGGLTIGSDPDRAQPGPAHPDRMRHAHRLGPATARASRPDTTGTDTCGAGRDPAGSDAFATDPVANDSDDVGCEQLPAPHAHRWPIATGSGAAAADTASHGRDEGLPGPTRLQGRPDAALGGHPDDHPRGADDGGRPGRSHPIRRHLVADPDLADGPDPQPDIGSSATTTPTVPAVAAIPTGVDWGVYEAAIRRWEAVLERPVPHPTQTGTHGRPALAPAFVEHLMGLPAGWVTNLPLPRTAQLRVLGNGVVPHQAAHAIALLLDDLADLFHAEPDATAA